MEKSESAKSHSVGNRPFAYCDYLVGPGRGPVIPDIKPHEEASYLFGSSERDQLETNFSTSTILLSNLNRFIIQVLSFKLKII